MRSLDRIEVISLDRIEDHERLQEWEQYVPASSLWRSPSSPPYSPDAQSRSPFSSPNQRAAAATDQSNSSPSSTPSEFEFDSLLTPEVKDELPVSPKFISSATEYWAAAAMTSQLGSGIRTRTQVSSVNQSQIADTGSHLSAHSRKQASTPSSPSVRQLISEEIRGGELHVDDESDLDFYSAPQTPVPRSRPPLNPMKQRPLSLDYPPSSHIHKQLIGTFVPPSNIGQRKSNSAVQLELRNSTQLYPELSTTTDQRFKGLTSSKSETHAHFNHASAISTSSSILHAWDKCSEDEKTSTSADLKKSGSSKSFRKWAFKDLLRRTVPNSKADAHYITKTLGASSSASPRSFFSTSRSTPNLVSPQASPLRSHPNYPMDSKVGPSTLQAGRPSSRAPRSPPHRPPSMHGWSPAHSLDTHLEARTPPYTSPPSRTPVPSPPRSPLSPHAAHYNLQKAQSKELGRKTFLPYRQSLLGCLGGSGAFSSDQLVW